jgi:hypothetical protein
MISHRFTPLIIILIALAIMAGSVVAANADPHPIGARAVALRDARSTPDYLHLLRAGHSVVLPKHTHGGCTGPQLIDLSAYTWRGGKLSPEQIDESDGWVYWFDHRGEAVIYDGLGFQNQTTHAVLVAGWCDH